MTEDHGIIILGYKPGPAAGQLIVTVDAPRFAQAEFVIAEGLRGSTEEKIVLRRMMKSRLELKEAIKEVDI